MFQWQSLQQFWRGLSRAQQCYLIALLSLCIPLFDTETSASSLAVFTLFSMAGFTLDAWPRFERLWHTLYGKAAMVFVYAVLLNLTLAYAEAVVNGFSGVKPDTMRYTVNLVALLTAPAVLIGGTAMLMLLYMLIHIGKITLYLCLRPFGFRSGSLFEGERYPISTLLVRILCLPITCSFMIQFAQSYLEADFIETNVGTQQWDLFDTTAVENAEAIVTDSDSPSELPAKKKRLPWYELIAVEFLYNVESLGKSACQLSGHEHGVHISEYDLLVIVPDPKFDAGYRFYVRPCNSPGQQQLLESMTERRQP